jgi:hypothetical protein
VTPAQTFSRWRREQPNQLFVIGLAMVVLAGSLWVGIRFRAASARLTAKRPAWQAVADQLATVQQQFRAPTPKETASLLAESGRVNALGVPASDRVSLMEAVSRIADEAGLADVRVSFRQGADSAFVRPRIVGTATLSPAPYSVVVDCAGGFAGVVQFVSNLPPSVSVSRLGASRQGNRAAYHILLSVYELPNGDSAS